MSTLSGESDGSDRRRWNDPDMGEHNEGALASGRPTLRQVAAVAGVSVKTASRALRGEGYVAPATSERVLDAARTVGFRLNAMASELRRGGISTLVGLVTGDLANPFYSRVAGGIERRLRMHGLQLVTASTDENPETERGLIDALLQRRVRALLIVSSSTDHRHLADEVGRGIPLVFVDRPPVGVEADSVVIDNRAGAVSGIEHLVAAGHRRIAVVADLTRLATHQARLDGVAEAMQAAGIRDWQQWMRRDAHDVVTARSTVRDLLDGPEPPTAVFTLNNRITAGALRAIRSRGADLTVGGSTDRAAGAGGGVDGSVGAGGGVGGSVAGDAGWPVALIGFDDFELSDVLGVTVVGYDAEEMGRQIARLALERMAGSDSPAQQVVIGTRLIVRGSAETRA